MKSLFDTDLHSLLPITEGLDVRSLTKKTKRPNLDKLVRNEPTKYLAIVSGTKIPSISSTSQLYFLMQGEDWSVHLERVLFSVVPEEPSNCVIEKSGGRICV